MTVCELTEAIVVYHYTPQRFAAEIWSGHRYDTANIPEVMKTRLQLQGELMKTSDAPKVYANVFDVFKKTWRNEGLRGLQRGLVPAVSLPRYALPNLSSSRLRPACLF